MEYYFLNDSRFSRFEKKTKKNPYVLTAFLLSNDNNKGILHVPHINDRNNSSKCYLNCKESKFLNHNYGAFDKTV